MGSDFLPVDEQSLAIKCKISLDQYLLPSKWMNHRLRPRHTRDEVPMSSYLRYGAKVDWHLKR